jgi:hypothetical protein
LLLPFFFLFGFMCGAKKGTNPNAPIFAPKKAKKSAEQVKNEKLSQNIMNYVGNGEGQVKL